MKSINKATAQHLQLKKKAGAKMLQNWLLGNGRFIFSPLCFPSVSSVALCLKSLIRKEKISQGIVDVTIKFP